VSPLTTLKSVVLPAPFGPISPVIEPSPTDSVHSASASTPPKRLVMPVTVSSGAVAAPSVAPRMIRLILDPSYQFARLAQSLTGR